MRNTHIRRMVAGTATALVAFAGMSALTASPAFAATSKVSVVHGIPGQPVDVYVNGRKTLGDFEPGKVAGPLTLPEGDYDIALTKPGEPIADAILKMVARQTYRKTRIPLEKYFARDGKPRLTLITCGGQFDRRTGHYRDNVVVTADPV
jgi:hypothetical protein